MASHVETVNYLKVLVPTGSDRRCYAFLRILNYLTALLYVLSPQGASAQSLGTVVVTKDFGPELRESEAH